LASKRSYNNIEANAPTSNDMHSLTYNVTTKKNGEKDEVEDVVEDEGKVVLSRGTKEDYVKSFEAIVVEGKVATFLQ